MDTAKIATPMHLRADFARLGFKLANTNEIRELWECNVPALGFSIQCLFIKKRGPIGEDAHAKRWKLFKVITGMGKILTARTNQKGEILGPIMIERLKGGDVRPVVAFEANTLYLEPGTIMLCFSSEPFDKSDSVSCPWLTEENAD